MCNAWNHPLGCCCGFDGRLGWGWGAGSGSADAIPYSFGYHTQMLSISKEFGYSITFPTQCRYCKEPIFLYANPNGAFVIFDKLGSPWPKHDCWGVVRFGRDYWVRDSEFRKEYRFPIPMFLDYDKMLKESDIWGVVVKSCPESIGNEYELYDGYKILTVWSNAQLRMGRCYRGRVRNNGDRYEFVDSIDLDTGDALGPKTARAKERAVTRSYDTLIWELETDLARLPMRRDSGRNFIGSAVDALSAGQPLIAALMLVASLQFAEDTLPPSIRSEHVMHVLRLLEEMGLEILVLVFEAKLRRSIPGKTKTAVSDRLSSMISSARLKLRHESESKIIQDFVVQWKSALSCAEELTRIHRVSLLTVKPELIQQLKELCRSQSPTYKKDFFR
jgi:hypothetical protein